MILKVFSVYDIKVKAFSQPSFMLHKGYAIRSFEKQVNDRNHPFGEAPSDFSLFEIGEYDDATAAFTNSKVPEQVLSGIQALKSPEGTTLA